MSGPKRFLVALVSATLLFGGHLRAHLHPKIRFLKFWQVNDAWVLIASVLLLGLVLLLIGEMLRRSRPLMARFCFILLLTQGFLVSLRPPPAVSSSVAPLLTAAVWVLFACGLLGKSREKRIHRLSGIASNLALVLSPLPFILFAQLLSFHTWLQTKAPSGHTNPSTNAPVILMVFDEWSYQRSVINGTFKPELTNFSRFSETAYFFTQAHSLGEETYLSVPRLLFQTHDTPVVRREGFGFLSSGREFHKPGRSLFDLVPNAQKSAVGFYLPYAAMLPGLDRAMAWPVSPKGSTFFGKMVYDYLDFLIYWQDPWVETIRRRFYTPEADKPDALLGPFWWRLNQQILDQALHEVETAQAGSFLFFHFAMPHPPAVFASDGSYRAPSLDDFAEPHAYGLSLQEADRIFGKICSAVDERPQFKNALIIVTSDHEWRQGITGKLGRPPNYIEKATHVPLMIHWPGQTNHLTATNRMEAVDLAASIQAALAGDHPPRF